MKKLIKLFYVTLTVFICSCTKESNQNRLLGTWKLLDTKNSCMVNQSIASSVTFNSNGSLGGNAFSDYVKYQVIDNQSVVMFKTDGSFMYYVYAIEKGILNISLDGTKYWYSGCGSGSFV